MEQENWARVSLVAEYVDRFAKAADQTIPSVVASVAPVEGLRALDICCGQGSLTVALDAAGAQVTGLDRSNAMLEIAKESSRRIDFLLGDAQNLPFPDGAFDVAVCGFGICHLPDQPKAIGEAYRVLKNEGRFAMTVWCGPDQSDSFEILYSAIRNHGDPTVSLPSGPDFHQFANPQTATQLLCGAGFASVQCQLVNCAWDFEVPDELCAAFEKATARASVLLARQPAKNLEAIRAAMRIRVHKHYKTGGRFRVPVPAALVVATK